MTLITVPLDAVASQTLTVALGGQSVRLNVYTRTFGLYVDVYVNNALIIGGVAALNLVKIVRSAYLGFIGDLYFYDTLAKEDPVYTGFASRFVLLYDDAL